MQQHFPQRAPNCGDKEAHRFDFWQDGLWAKVAGDIPEGKKRDGRIVQDIHPLGSDVGKSSIAPHVIFSACYSCDKQYENPCACLDEEMADYKWKNEYSITGPNSNTFVGRMTRYCGLIGDLSRRHLVPVGAVGWDYVVPASGILPADTAGERADQADLKERGERATELRSEFHQTKNKPTWK